MDAFRVKINHYYLEVEEMSNMRAKLSEQGFRFSQLLSHKGPVKPIPMRLLVILIVIKQ